MSRYYLIYFICIIFFYSCKESNAPDVSDIQADFELIRTEKVLTDIQTLEDFNKAIATHPAFYDLYFKNIIHINPGNDKDSLFAEFINFKQDSTVIAVNEFIEKEFSDFKSVQSDLKSFFKYLQYYFPDQFQVPNVYTINSDFGYQTFIFEDENKRDAIGIGLDMFLNPALPYKMMFPDNTNFSDYLTRSWNKQFVAKKVADLYINEITGESPGHRLLDYMIHHGKNLYITSLLLPFKNDSIIHEYTSEQMKWCYENELQMWSFFLDGKLFYESNFKKIGKYVFPSPKSPDMPDAAPGRTANFIGYQIVKAYMKRYPDTTIEELINFTDSQAFLEKSKYKPAKK